ncbi:MAG: 5'/3'-nucleotidase SurE, partial [Chloroflexi bacterium]|nr:5'/3'-nucleotidase SurE [Chloroflexota bacterium]
MHLLVTNDDGVNAPGLLALTQALRSVGRVTVMAPDKNWSASGHVKTMHKPLRVRETRLAYGSPAFASDGAPSDCVALALLGFIPEPIDIVVAGINPYANIGHDVTYSGTVTAAMEAAICKVPGIAVSVDGGENGGKVRGAGDEAAAYSAAAEWAARIAAEVGKRGLPPYTILNVNVPALPVEKIKGVQVTRQGLRVYRDELVRRLDPRGVPYYWIGGEAPTG